MDLSLLRKEIDEIDEQLVTLLLRRMEISKEVAKFKIENNLPVLNEKREKEILDKVAEKCGEQGDAVKSVFVSIMDASKELQKIIINETKEG